MKEFRFIATGYKGLGDVHEKECKELGISVIAKEEGKVLCKGTLSDVVKANLGLKTINKIHLILEESEFSSLDDIYRLAKNIDYTSILDKNLTFAVKTSRVGEHDFTSLDINKVVGEAIIDSFRESKGETLKVRLKNPDIQIRVYVVNNKVRITLNTSGESLHKRGYRKIKHIAPLKPTLAASLAILANLEQNSVVMDPFCGTGTIVIESAFRIRKIYPNVSRNLPLFRIRLFENIDIEQIKNTLYRNVDSEDKLFGSDINKRYIKGAKLSVENLKLERIFLAIRDATSIRYNKEITHLISNPPYGIKMWNPSINKVAIKFLHELKQTEYRKILISPNRKWREIISKEFEVEEQRKVFYGKFTNFITIFY